MYINMFAYDDSNKFDAEYDKWCELVEEAEALTDEVRKLMDIVETCEAVSDDAWQSADDKYTNIVMLLDSEYINEWRLEYAKELVEELMDTFSWIA